MTFEVGHAVSMPTLVMQHFMGRTKKLSEILGRRAIFVPKSCCSKKKRKGLHLESVSDF